MIQDLRLKYREVSSHGKSLSEAFKGDRKASSNALSYM